MFNQAWNAESAAEFLRKEQEKEMQPKIQIAELQKQSVILADSKQITKENAEIMRCLLEQNKQNAEYTRQILECTKQNQISADAQAKASNKLATVAIYISVFALIINLLQLFK